MIYIKDFMICNQHTGKPMAATAAGQSPAGEGLRREVFLPNKPILAKQSHFRGWGGGRADSRADLPAQLAGACRPGRQVVAGARRPGGLRRRHGESLSQAALALVRHPPARAQMGVGLR